MSYRLAVVAYLAYPDRVAAIYRDTPGLAEAPWEIQRDTVARHPSMPVLPFRRDFAALGLEVMEFYPDADALNGAWARDRGVDLSWDGPPIQARTAVLLGQLAEFRPDALYIHGLLGLHPDFYAEVKDRVPSLRVLTGFEGMAVRKPYLRDLDELFVCVPPFAEDARRLGMDATVLYHAFDAAVLKRPELSGAAGETFDLTFAGSSGYGGEDFHSARYWTLFELMVRAGLRAWMNEPWLLPPSQRPDEAAERALEDRLRRVLAETAPDRATAAAREAVADLAGRPPLPLARVFPERCRPPLYGVPMLGLLRRSRITFNMHAANAAGAVGNYRLFEATGVGACLLTDHGSNLAELFVPDEEVVTYRSSEEAVEKVRYLLDHEAERRRIAAAGQARTLSAHSFAKRCARIDDAIRRRF